VTRIYLDVCCLNRPFDDQTQERIRLEAEAVVLVLARFKSGVWEWISSEVVDYEIAQIPDLTRKRRIRSMASYAPNYVWLEQAEVSRAQELETFGFPAFDALHLACAESGGADVFLSTDDKLLRRAARYSSRLHIRVANPLIWIRRY
jgi:predicted nucleic acid-binding protein